MNGVTLSAAVVAFTDIRPDYEGRVVIGRNGWVYLPEEEKYFPPHRIKTVFTPERAR